MVKIAILIANFTHLAFTANSIGTKYNQNWRYVLMLSMVKISNLITNFTSLPLTNLQQIQ